MTLVLQPAPPDPGRAVNRSRIPRSRYRPGWAASWVLAALVLASVIPPAASAQDTPPWIEMTIVQVDPDRVDEFLTAQRELSLLEKEAGTPWRSVSRTAIFGDTYQFLITTPLTNFARFDRAAAAQPGRDAIVTRIRRVITSRTTYALRTTPALDNPLPADVAPALMIVQIVSVAPGREQDYLRVMTADVLPHFDEAEMHHTSGALTFGGESGYVHVFHVERFASLDQGSPLARALGPQGALEVLAKLAGVVRRSEQWIVRYVPDASFRPETEEETEEEEEDDDPPGR